MAQVESDLALQPSPVLLEAVLKVTALVLDAGGRAKGFLTVCYISEPNPVFSVWIVLVWGPG
jgi:hypothetical protein